MYGYPRSSPSELVWFAGVLLLLFALVPSILFNTLIADRVTMACAVTGSVLFFVGRMANVFGRRSIMSQKPGWASGLRILASVLWTVVLPAVIFWVYLKVSGGR